MTSDPNPPISALDRYIQTFSQEEQAMLDSCAFQPVLGRGCVFTKVTDIPADQAIEPLWEVLPAHKKMFPPITGPNQVMSRIRARDMVEFEKIWIAHAFPNADFAIPLRGLFRTDAWKPIGDQLLGYGAVLLVYRTFYLALCADFPDREESISTSDLQRILASCIIEQSPDGEVPACFGTLVQGGQQLFWNVVPTSIPRVHHMIRNSIPYIRSFSFKEEAKQYAIIAALNRLYRDVNDAPPPGEHPELSNLEYNRAIDLTLRQHDIPMDMFRSVPTATDSIAFGEYAGFEIGPLVEMFVESRTLSEQLKFSFDYLPIMTELDGTAAGPAAEAE